MASERREAMQANITAVMPDRSARRLCVGLALLTVGLHVATSRGYGHFRDELYYLACAQHPAFGYVDHPPFIALVAGLTRAVLGTSTPALRFPAALAGGGTVLFTGLIAVELGGGALSVATAGVAVMLGPIYVGLFSLLSMNAFEVFFWTWASFLLVRVLRTGNERLWLAFGAVVGVALENKHSAALFLVATVVGLALTSARAHLASREFRRGMIIAAVLFLPNVLWELRHGIPTLEFLRNAQAYKNLGRPPLAFLAEQVLVLSPIALPVWLGGLVFLLGARGAQRYRALGLAYLAVLTAMIVQQGKSYYLAPAYPPLFAAGGFVVERLTRHRAAGWLVPCALAAGGLTLAPLAKPLLSEETFIRYQRALGQDPKAGVDERHALGALPQLFADQHGWPEMVATIAQVYHALPPHDRDRACILVQNYGEAGAVDFFGSALGLPPALSGHNSYWMWGQGACDGSVMIIVGGSVAQISEYYAEVVQAGTIAGSAYTMPSETALPVFVARQPRHDLRTLWDALKIFI